MPFRCWSALLSLWLAAISSLLVPSAFAHGVVGNRLFIEPLVTEDANPKNELDFPILEMIQTPPGHLIGFNYSFEKKLLPRLSVSFDNSIISFSPNGQSSTVGLGNIGFGAKYAIYQNPQHEFIFSSAFHVEFPTGNARLGATSFTTLTPAFLYAKGFGDLPSPGALNWLRPLALQGDFTADFPANASPSSGAEKVPHIDAVVEYSFPYLNAFVRHANSKYSLGDGGFRKGASIGAITGDLFPFAEFNFSWVPDNLGRGLRPQGFIRPGIVYIGPHFEIGGAAELPANDFTGRSTGAIVIFDLFLDDLFPKARRLFHR
ncbi:MAG TPA: hypothetical protein VGR72_01070 [Candidatus Acidoferrales bacterium]|nr:hypothetical protein [Candidatus Acidoferrales bacterium]